VLLARTDTVELLRYAQELERLPSLGEDPDPLDAVAFEWV
jgi:hypothetical protein